MIGGCRRIGEWDTGRSRQWQIAIATSSFTVHPVGMHIVQDRDSVHEPVLHGVHSGGVWRTWSCSRR